MIASGFSGSQAASGNSNQRVLRCSPVLRALLGPRVEIADEDYVPDLLATLTERQLFDVLLSPPQLKAGDWTAPLKLLDECRRPQSPRSLVPASVQVHLYSLNSTFVRPNRMLSKAAIGGAYHIGVEVFGAEWSYGIRGVRNSLPRSDSDHIYEYTVYMGDTEVSLPQLAGLLHEMCQEWQGCDYDLVGLNCCNFGRRLVDELGVGPLPAFIDRLSRSLHAGREVGKRAVKSGTKIAVHTKNVAVATSQKAANSVGHLARAGSSVGKQVVNAVLRIEPDSPDSSPPTSPSSSPEGGTPHSPAAASFQYAAPSLAGPRRAAQPSQQAHSAPGVVVWPRNLQLAAPMPGPVQVALTPGGAMPYGCHGPCFQAFAPYGGPRPPGAGTAQPIHFLPAGFAQYDGAVAGYPGGLRRPP
eukprot:TRINITY_DN21757_c0_g1_i1.p1 TRINITY_DN21757_c0_g1~~TRINITY_DN21757_c0_g1_i1.p1  ORF type:complete len:413 (-),score=42.73 TRINITY_DN21757_c0_g1_i1:49-1287(-)